eukprot:2763053-Prymnesium_polylepis.2
MRARGLTSARFAKATKYIALSRLTPPQFELTPFDTTRGSAEFGFKLSGSSCPAGRSGGVSRSAAVDSIPSALVEGAEASGIVHHDKLWQWTGCAHGAHTL